MGNLFSSPKAPPSPKASQEKKIYIPANQTENTNTSIVPKVSVPAPDTPAKSNQTINDSEQNITHPLCQDSCRIYC